MALANTGKAIGKVTELLCQHLNDRTHFTITVGRVEPSSGSNSPSTSRLNLFLYEALFDPSLKNFSLDEGQPPPLWLVLKYLITAFDDHGNSDSVEAQENLGEGLRALQELSFLSLSAITLPGDIRAALSDNPEVLKITFDEAPAELLSKLMQGSDEKYRFSMSFQVRPVMIATGSLPSYSLLVGVDYTATSNQRIGEAGIQMPVIPSMGPSISEVMPPKFEVNDTLTILGSDLNLSGLSVCLGAAEFAVTSGRANRLQCRVTAIMAGGRVMSAGSYPLSVVQTLPTGRRRSSNLLIGALLPTLTLNSAVPVPRVAGNIVMTGTLLGRAEDDIFVALYKDGQIVKVYDAVRGAITDDEPEGSHSPFTFAADQSSLTLQLPNSQSVLLGKYRVILRINGQQAKNSPQVDLVA